MRIRRSWPSAISVYILNIDRRTELGASIGREGLLDRQVFIRKEVWEAGAFVGLLYGWIGRRWALCFFFFGLIPLHLLRFMAIEGQ